MNSRPTASPGLFSRDGRRKYLTPTERADFIAAAQNCERPELGTLCLVLAFTGCRISEALALKTSSIDLHECVAVIRSLKKRGANVFRQVPLPPEIVACLCDVHALRNRPSDESLWTLSRSRAWQLIKEVMDTAAVALGPHRTPKGLRHAFGIHAVRSGVPPNLVQRWLGHASLETTMIYMEAYGEEERAFACRMWDDARP